MESYPDSRELTNPRTINDTISLKALQKVRIDADHKAAHGYSYATIGNNKFVDSWIDYGVKEGLLKGFWQKDLERFARMERGPANQILMDQLNRDEL